MLTPQDAQNTLTLLNRVTVTGVQEAQVLALLAHKLRSMCVESTAQSTQTEAPSGENSPSTAE